MGRRDPKLVELHMPTSPKSIVANVPQEGGKWSGYAGKSGGCLVEKEVERGAVEPLPSLLALGQVPDLMPERRCSSPTFPGKKKGACPVVRGFCRRLEESRAELPMVT